MAVNSGNIMYSEMGRINQAHPRLIIFSNPLLYDLRILWSSGPRNTVNAPVSSAVSLNGIFNERDRSKDVSGFVTLEIKRSRDGERGGGIKGFLERRNGGTWCAGHKARYEKLGRKPLEAFKTDDTPPQIEGSHGVADSDLMGK